MGKFSPFLFMCWCLRRCGERVLLIDVTHNDWDLGWLRPVSFPSPLAPERAGGLGKLTRLGPQPPQGGLATLLARDLFFMRVEVF